jgi:hypothetical protein
MGMCLRRGILARAPGGLGFSFSFINVGFFSRTCHCVKHSKRFQLFYVFLLGKGLGKNSCKRIMVCLMLLKVMCLSFGLQLFQLLTSVVQFCSGFYF